MVPDLPRTFSPGTADRFLCAAGLAVAATALGHALQLTNGTIGEQPILLLTLTVLLTGLAVWSPGVGFWEKLGERPVVVLLGAGVIFQLAVHLTTPPGVYLQATPKDYAQHHVWVAIAAVVIGGGLSGKPWLGRLCIPLLLLCHFVLGLWLLRVSPNPFIDVFAWHREAFRLLGEGLNPYAADMPNIYGHTQWYAPGLADASTVKVGYPYPPLSLLLAAPGHLIKSDYRYANLAALTVSGGLMAYARPGRIAFGAAAVFLFTPRGLFVLEQGWTESTVVFALALTVFCACRAPRLLPWALGLLLAIKQYLIFALPLSLMLVPRPWSRRTLQPFFLKAVGLAAAITLPLALWSPSNFLRSVVSFQGKQPFRDDSLSYLAWTAKNGVSVLPLWLSFVMLLPALALALWRGPRTPAGFASACALVYLMFFAFAKQAFCNYYFLIVGALCCAIAAMAPGTTAASSASTVDTASPTPPY